ncbi:MAG: Fic family protein [Patescibacteria group bacterium]
MQQNAVYPFQLPLLPPKASFNDPAITKLVLDARVKLAELNGLTFSLANPFLLLSPAIIKESIASSEIENIHTTILNVLENQLFPEDEQKKPDKEVLRYREAALWGFNKRKKLPISSRLIQGIHKKLLPDLAGSFRITQNAILDGKTKEIIYTPPVQTEISNLMGNLENFINQQNGLVTPDWDPLIQIAMCHYQFESIHPFNDGNGRTGRILMVLQLVDKNILSLPTLYISGYINKNKNAYYQLLRTVTKTGKWEEYILFMLQGFADQATETTLLALKIKNLFQEQKQELKSVYGKIYSADLLESMFSFPVISPVKLGSELAIHYGTASRYLVQLEKGGFLQSKWVGKYHFFANIKLLKLIHG